MKIPVVIVDDQEVDRYLVKRYLDKSGDFDALIEMNSGEMFLEEFYGDRFQANSKDFPLLVLMDINMLGLSGFDTAEEAQRLTAEGKGPSRLIVLMFSSANNEREKNKAKEIDMVKGYISKPLDTERVAYIRDLYQSFL